MALSIDLKINNALVESLKKNLTIEGKKPLRKNVAYMIPQNRLNPLSCVSSLIQFPVVLVKHLK